MRTCECRINCKSLTWNLNSKSIEVISVFVEMFTPWPCMCIVWNGGPEATPGHPNPHSQLPKKSHHEGKHDPSSVVLCCVVHGLENLTDMAVAGMVAGNWR